MAHNSEVSDWSFQVSGLIPDSQEWVMYTLFGHTQAFHLQGAVKTSIKSTLSHERCQSVNYSCLWGTHHWLHSVRTMIRKQWKPLAFPSKNYLHFYVFQVNATAHETVVTDAVFSLSSPIASNKTMHVLPIVLTSKLSKGREHNYPCSSVRVIEETSQWIPGPSYVSLLQS